MGNFLSSVYNIGKEKLKQGEFVDVGENVPKSMGIPDPNDPDRVIDFGALGDFSSKVDKTAQRSYVESGYIGNVRPRHFEILMQEPDLTVIVKKRMFSSLADNYRAEYMDAGERNLIRASKRLFQNKCQAISTYERLVKIEQAIKLKGVLDDFATPLLVSGIEALEKLGVNIVSSETKGILDQIRKLESFSNPENFTTWFVDPDVNTNNGEGNGTFSLTLASSVSTSSGVEFGTGSCNLTIEDPYHLMSISDRDIDKAIADIYNFRQDYSLFQFSEQELSKQNNELLGILNNERMSRGAPSIIWRVNDDTILNKRVRAFIDEVGREIIFDYNPGIVGIGSGISIDDSAKFGDAGLTDSEIEKFEIITKNTYLILNLKRQKESQIDEIINDKNKKEVEYIRSKMRLQFANKNIIQVMDSVNIFISSKTMVDNKVIGIDTSSVMGSNNNLLSLFNSSLGNLEQSFNNVATLFGGSSGTTTSFVEAEKSAIVGDNFPTWLWIAMRNQFTRQAAGTHVFAGVVKTVSEKYSNGKYELTVSCGDNSIYFDLGKINVKPSADVPERSIFDPLTPFDLEFDGATGLLVDDHPKLLPENESLLFSGVVKFKNGSRFLGAPMTQFLYLLGSNDIKSASETNDTQRVFFDPSGFVYRWKSGIGTFTYTGSKHPSNRYREETSPLMTKDPFAGQDVMNVLSLLISGQPYNYNTFISSAIQNANFSLKDGGSEAELSRSFYRGLISDLQINNQLWGNFIPFKKLIMTENAYNFMIQGQFSIQKAGNKMDYLLNKRSKLFDTLVAADSAFADNPNIYELDINGDMGNKNVTISDANIPVSSINIPAVGIATEEIFALDIEIGQQQDQITQSLSTVNTNDGTLQIFGDDISFSPEYDGWGNQAGEEERAQQRSQLRKKIKNLTQRRLWKVKANQDQNLLIIDDQYDKDYDIQAFERALAGKMDLLKSDYQTAGDQIKIVSKILGLEVFANTQGHIEIKPPGYNKMPSSVFYRMVTDGKRAYPKTLESLFINQAEGLIDRLKIIEDEIRLRGTAFGLGDDTAIQGFLSGSQLSKKSGANSASFTFKFITDSDGNFGGKNYTVRALVMQDSPDAAEDKEFKALKASTSSDIASQIRQRGLFDYGSQLTVIYDSNRYIVPSSDDILSRYENIRWRLGKLKGQQAPSFREMAGGIGIKDVSSGAKPVRSQADNIKLTKEISTYVSERQNVLKQLRNAFKNLEQGALINNDPEARRNTLYPNFQRKNSLPSVIEHLIEDEEEDDLGPGAGGRYIIKDNQIISFDISENSPDYTTVEVIGVPGEGYIKPVGSVGIDGNMQTSAIAVDYDLWRMYGFKVGNSIRAPYISDAEAQAAPLASWNLTEQRRKIISGNMTIVGNEYMQPGEVVYIEDRDLLFYVENVSHSFSFGSTFTTSLKLTYGHNPGEYFPTMLDVIGKGLYSKRNQANKIRHARHGNANGDQNLGAVIVETNAFTIGNNPEDMVQRIVGGTFGEKNRATLTQMLLALKTTQAPGSEEEAFIEIRYYYNEQKGFSANQDLNNKAEAIKEWLKNPTKKSFGFTGESGSSDDVIFSKGGQLPDDKFEGMKISEIDRLVSVRAVGLKDPVGPSSKAWEAARSEIGAGVDLLGTFNDITNSSPIMNTGNTNSNSKSSSSNKSKAQAGAITEEKALYNTVLDIWVKFKPIVQTKEYNNTISQAANIENDELDGISEIASL